MGLMALGSMILVFLLPAAVGGEEAAPPVVDLGPATVRAETAALLLSDQTGGTIDIAALAFADRASAAGPDEAQIETTFVVEVGLSSVRGVGQATTTASAADPFTADLFVYVLGDRNQNLGHVAHRLEIRPTALAANRLTLVTDLTLPAGNHRARILLRSFSGSFGLIEVPVLVGPLILPPLLPDSTPDRWVVRLGEPPPATTWLGKGGPLPTARTELGSTDPPTPVDVVALGSPGPTAHFDLRITPLGGGEPRVLELIAAGDDEEQPKRHRYRTMLTPAQLAPGSHRVEVIDHQDRRSVSPSTEIVVMARVEDPWAVLGLSPEPESPWPARASMRPSERPKAPKKSALVQEYLAVLDELTEGRLEAALKALVEMETRAVAAAGASDLNRLENAQASTLAAILQQSRTALLPIAQLHLRCAAEHYDARRALLANHGERLIRGIAESLGSAPLEHSAAARIFGVLALQDLRRGAWLAAKQQFQTALEHDPHHLGSLLGLGTLQARGTYFDEAEELFTRILETNPKHDEARLRRASNRIRSGHSEDAISELESLRSSSEPWIAVLAVQELARAIIRSDPAAGPTHEHALQLLGEELERWPGHPVLTLQKAQILDSLGRIEDSSRLLRRLDQPAPETFENERFLYNRWPSLELEKDLDQLQSQAHTHIPDLARILRQLPERKRSDAR